MSSNYIRSLTEKRYSGSKTAIVIGIDVGTTFSGVSYAILRPNMAPKIYPVTKFSDQSCGDNKIPSVILYDDHGSPKAIGASIMKAMVMREANQKNWLKVEYFKMHLRPTGSQLQTNGLKIGDLPPEKSPEEVMGDFLRYLVGETGKYVSNTLTADLWHQVKDDAIYILGHPNGWSGKPQQRYRASAILGGLIPDNTEGHNRIKFVTEGEASALSCLSGGLGSPTLKKGFRFIIADAGGGTIDTAAYEIVGSSPLRLRECGLPDSRFAGSIFVNQRGKCLLQRKLRNSDYDNEKSLDDWINDEFEISTKRQFTGEEDGLLQVGSRRDNDETLGISGGFLLLQREELSECFDDSVSEIIASIRAQIPASRSDEATTAPVWLVGGFASSTYLLREIQRAFEISGITVQTPETNLSKAVANGTILHYLDAVVFARTCPTSYGTDCYTRFNPMRPDHRSKPELIERRMEGIFIGPIFSVIAEKGSSIDVERTFCETYGMRLVSKEKAAQFTADLLCYDGELPVPYWYNENKDKFRKVCTLEADLSSLCRKVPEPSSLLEALLGSVIGPHWEIAFDIELSLGTTEVVARIKWEENGVVKYGPAKINWLS